MIAISRSSKGADADQVYDTRAEFVLDEDVQYSDEVRLAAGATGTVDFDDSPATLLTSVRGYYHEIRVHEQFQVYLMFKRWKAQLTWDNSSGYTLLEGVIHADMNGSEPKTVPQWTMNRDDVM